MVLLLLLLLFQKFFFSFFRNISHNTPVWPQNNFCVVLYAILRATSQQAQTYFSWKSIAWFKKSLLSIVSNGKLYVFNSFCILLYDICKLYFHHFSALKISAIKLSLRKDQNVPVMRKRFFVTLYENYLRYLYHFVEEI